MKQIWLGQSLDFPLYIFFLIVEFSLFQTRVNYTKELWELTQIYNVLDPIRLRGGFASLVERNRTANQPIKINVLWTSLFFDGFQVILSFNSYFIHLYRQYRMVVDYTHYVKPSICYFKFSWSGGEKNLQFRIVM